MRALYVLAAALILVSSMLWMSEAQHFHSSGYEDLQSEFVRVVKTLRYSPEHLDLVLNDVNRSGVLALRRGDTIMLRSGDSFLVIREDSVRRSACLILKTNVSPRVVYLKDSSRFEMGYRAIGLDLCGGSELKLRSFLTGGLKPTAIGFWLGKGVINASTSKYVSVDRVGNYTVRSCLSNENSTTCRNDVIAVALVNLGLSIYPETIHLGEVSVLSAEGMAVNDQFLSVRVSLSPLNRTLFEDLHTREFSFSEPLSPPDVGSYILKLEAIDSYGRRFTRTAELQVLPSVIHVDVRVTPGSGPPGTSFLVQISASSTVNLSRVKLVLVNGSTASVILSRKVEGNQYRDELSIRADRVGTYKLLLNVSDSSGNSKSASAMFTVTNNKKDRKPITVGLCLYYDSQKNRWYIKARAVSYLDDLGRQDWVVRLVIYQDGKLVASWSGRKHYVWLSHMVLEGGHHVWIAVAEDFYGNIAKGKLEGYT